MKSFVAVLAAAFMAMASPTHLRVYPNTKRELGPLCTYIGKQFSQDLTCDCSWDLKARQVNFGCSYAKVCLVNDLLCGQPNYNGTLVLLPQRTLSSDVCLNFDPLNFTLPNITLPPFLGNITLPQLPQIPKKMCMSVNQCTQNLTYVCGCSAAVDNTTCNSCSVCGSGRSVSVDCTNVHPLLNATCLGI